jgi:hypothetical protein
MSTAAPILSVRILCTDSIVTSHRSRRLSGDCGFFRVTKSRRGARHDTISWNFHSHGAAKETDRQDQLNGVPEFQQDPFHTGKSALNDSDSSSHLQELAGSCHKPVLDRFLKRYDLPVIDGSGSSADTYDMKDSGCREDRQAPANVESAEDIPGEQWQLDTS